MRRQSAAHWTSPLMTFGLFRQSAESSETISAMNWFGPEATLTTTESSDELIFTSQKQRRGVGLLLAGLFLTGALVLWLMLGWSSAVAVLLGAALGAVGFLTTGSLTLRVTAAGFKSGSTFYTWRTCRSLEYGVGSEYGPKGLAASFGKWSKVIILPYLNAGQCEIVIDAIHKKFPNIQFDTSNDGLGTMLHEVIDMFHSSRKPVP